jgi:hypothetical protein
MRGEEQGGGEETAPPPPSLMRARLRLRSLLIFKVQMFCQVCMSLFLVQPMIISGQNLVQVLHDLGEVSKTSR